MENNFSNLPGSSDQWAFSPDSRGTSSWIAQISVAVRKTVIDTPAAFARAWISFYRNTDFRDTHILLPELLTFLAGRQASWTLSFLAHRRIILRKTVLLHIPARNVLIRKKLRELCGWVRLLKIIFHQFHQKMHGSRSIRQRMKYLEIDPVLIVTHPKKKRFFVRNIKSAAGCTCFFLYHCRNITSLQIKPEQSLS